MRTVRTRLVAVALGGVVSTAGIGLVAAAPANAQALPRCGNGSLAVTRTFTQGGDGHGWMSLIYRNTGTRSCSVTGYPGLDAVTKKGHVLAHAARSRLGYAGGGPVRTVTIKPGGYASASVEWLNFNGRTGGACRFASRVNTIVANTSRVHRIPVSVSVCGLQVHPTVAGTPMYPHYGPAQVYWIRGSRAVAANTNYYLAKAEHQLRIGKDYPTQVAQLAQLISLPLTGLTSKQLTEARADVAALDSFFATPGLYS